jgi:hypothetical protein
MLVGSTILTNSLSSNAASGKFGSGLAKKPSHDAGHTVYAEFSGPVSLDNFAARTVLT